MNQKLALILSKVIPKPLVSKVRYLEFKINTRKPRAIFEKSSKSPPWLEANMLEKLQQEYRKPPRYSYDPDSLKKRGIIRAKAILKLLGDDNVNTFLELGCNDGMVCWALQKNGKSTVAIDTRGAERFDERAKREGVQLLQGDASCLPFKDETFDCVFEYAAMEHFMNPESVLQEAIRVVRTGGYIYLDGGLLYMSPSGLHAHDYITVPYCQFLFPREMIEQFSNERDFSAGYFEELNGWSLEEFRNLWDKYSHKLQKVKYKEIFGVEHFDLIAKYPSCFKSKTDNFDNLVISSIQVLFRKSN